MLKYLLEKEFKYVIRDKFISKMIFAMPLMMMLIFPWAANQEIRNQRLTVVDKDRSDYSQRMVQKITSSGYFTLVDISVSNEEALHDVDKNRSDIILEIDSDFEKNIINGVVANVMISGNAVNGMKGGLGLSYLSQIIGDFTMQLQEENTSHIIMPIKIAPQYRFNPQLDYKIFMVPAIIVILITILCGFLPALNIVGEKEVGTIEQINVSPVKRGTFILSKLIPFWVIGLIALTLCFIIAAVMYGLTPAGGFIGYLWIYLAACLYILVVSGFGLIISNYSSTLQQAMFITFFSIMIFILMSGLFTPINSMPNWAQKLTYINPLRYFIQVMRMIYLKGSSLADLYQQLLALSSFAVLLNLWAIRSYSKSN